MNETTQRMQTTISNATILSVANQRNNTLVTISYRDCPRCPPQELVLVVTPDTRIRTASNQPANVRSLRPGMTINATVSTAMTKSIPPQAQAFSIQITQPVNQTQTTVGRIVEVNQRQQFITTISNGKPSSLIRFNISPDTLILDPANRRIFINRLFPGLRVSVTHANFMTASIPPQTNAFVIRVIR